MTGRNLEAAYLHPGHGLLIGIYTGLVRPSNAAAMNYRREWKTDTPVRNKMQAADSGLQAADSGL